MADVTPDGKISPTKDEEIVTPDGKISPTKDEGATASPDGKISPTGTGTENK
ncbi:hypothetical protein [Mangrovactinospora gilvigrisea]|uniref:hypothetical protein n=1 Tax=Mangrovactinospora gilvigrisea TaxID=1428644 RepID=UPI000B1A6FB0|nr:hypothetical protein [Mangrovactinospora gilvigrisea]